MSSVNYPMHMSEKDYETHQKPEKRLIIIAKESVDANLGGLPGLVKSETTSPVHKSNIRTSNLPAFHRLYKSINLSQLKPLKKHLGK